MALSTILTTGAKVGGKYEVVDVIGYGGMGVVYKVREQVGAVSRIRALKTVLPQFASDANVVGRFRQEAEKMCMLEHENIVPVLSYSEEGEFPYLVMPFIEGQTLKEYLASYQAEHGKPLPLSDVMVIGLEVVRGLEVAHRFVSPETSRPQPMIHRDIKPGNIMVRVEDRGGEHRLRVLIMDFGIAKVLSGEDTGHSMTDVIGTVKYASPEQIRRGKDIDPRADIYSLGMVLFELYTGRHMFSGLSEHSVLMRMMQREVQETEIPFPDGTPESFRDLIQRCVAVDREQRFASVAELRTLMRRILEEQSERGSGEAEQARRVAAAERSRALESGAGNLAVEEFRQGDSLLAHAESAFADRRFRDAAGAFQDAAAAFEKANRSAAVESGRRELLTSLEALTALRDAAIAARADRLAAAEFTQAQEESVSAARSLGIAAGNGGARGSSDVTAVIPRVDLQAAARHLAEAERLFREATRKAKEAGLRESARSKSQLLAERISAQRAAFERTPPQLRRAAGLPELESVEATAAAAARSASQGAFDAAITGADQALGLLAKVDAQRETVLATAVDDLAGKLAARLAAVESSGDHQLALEAHAEVRRIADLGARLRESGQPVEAFMELEKALGAAERLAKEIARRAAERERALRDAAGASRDMRRQAEAARQEAAPLAQAGDVGCKGAERAWTAAEDAAHSGDWPAALDHYRQALAEYQGALRADRNRKAATAAATARAELRRAQDRLRSLATNQAEAVERTRSETLAEQGEQRLAAGEFADALPLLTTAAERLARLAGTITQRQERERLDARLAELRREVAAKGKSLAALGREATGHAESQRLLAALAAADTQADPAAVITGLERLLPELDRHTQNVRGELERARLEREANAQRTQADAARSAAERLGGRATHSPAFARAVANMDEAAAALSGRDFAPAEARFAEASRVFADLVSEIERADRAERLQALERRRANAEAKLAIVPSVRKLRRGRQAATQALQAASSALARGDETEAERALGEAETTASTLTVQAAQPAPSRWPLFGAAGGVAAAAVGVAVWYSTSGKPNPASEPSQTTKAATPASQVASRIQPTIAVASLPQDQPTAASRAAPEPTAAEVASAPKPEPEPPKAEPPAPPVLALASAKPTNRSIKLKPGGEQRFEASLKSGDPDSLQWRLEGETVGRGASLRLGKEQTADVGRRKLDLVALRDGGTTTLRSWDLDIVAPPLDFAGLEPSTRTLERSPGTPVSFRAPVKNPDGEKMSFLWEINGRQARNADGPNYEFAPDGPGDYEVKVRATAPWGATVANTWNLKINAPKPAPRPVEQPVAAPPTPAEVAARPKTPEDIPKPAGDAQAELRGWIQSYCSAFERKDTDALIQLGHLSTQAEAARLKQVLSSMDNLKLSCTNPSITVKGDQATVSFDRKDHWTDPRGTEMERALPRISKNLRRANGQWVAVP